MTSFSRILTCALLAILAGCMSTKHQYLTAPQINGTVTSGGVPVAGIHVQLADVLTDAGAPAAGALKDEAVTDAQGHFSVGPLRRVAKKTGVPLLKVDQHTVPWGLRLSRGDQAWQAGWLSDPDMFGDVPKAPISALCDLAMDSKSSVIDGDIAIVGKGPCILQLVEANKKK